ncbi:MAG: DsbA family oxidoreductase [Roseovarius sp.]|nr:DsbA family oxidoreductase [Roseovarius sp.]
MVSLDIVSDPVCPWCYIGKTLLDRALAERPRHPFTIRWQPFQLNPDMPADGMDRHTYLETKFGGREAAARAYAPVLERAEEARLTLDFAAIQRTPNTLDAHRLIHWAGIEDRQMPVAMALFRAYFREGRDIGDKEVLADIADSAGMDAAVVRKLLESDVDSEAIHKKDRQFREMGISGVPTFIIAGQHAVPGCQPPELWIKVIDEIAERAARDGAAGA